MSANPPRTTTEPLNTCPACGAANPPHAGLCAECGAALHTATRAHDARVRTSGTAMMGRDDLVEGALPPRTGALLSAMAGGVVLLLCGALGLATMLGWNQIFGVPVATGTPTRTSTPLATAPNAPANPTARPTVLFVTVTPAPPTDAPTATPGPCVQRVLPGDSLIAVAARCGHRNMDVLPIILATNDLADVALIQVGQELIIPWPTPTLDPNVPTPDATQVAQAVSDGDVASSFLFSVEEEAIVVPTALPTATLPPGLQWHVVQPNENIILIAVAYNANIEILRQLNPEMTFAQCDFGEFGGGPDCFVPVSIGQYVRVPAPTPTATLSPTPSGSETATPTATATFNRPSLASPGDRALFTRTELITLRWVASGTLGAGETYRVRVQDRNAMIEYITDTRDTSLLVPSVWQGQAGGRHTYTWTVSVVSAANPDQEQYITDARTFIWEAQPRP